VSKATAAARGGRAACDIVLCHRSAAEKRHEGTSSNASSRGTRVGMAAAAAAAVGGESLATAAVRVAQVVAGADVPTLMGRYTGVPATVPTNRGLKRALRTVAKVENEEGMGPAVELAACALRFGGQGAAATDSTSARMLHGGLRASTALVTAVKRTKELKAKVATERGLRAELTKVRVALGKTIKEQGKLITKQGKLITAQGRTNAKLAGQLATQSDKLDGVHSELRAEIAAIRVPVAVRQLIYATVGKKRPLVKVATALWERVISAKCVPASAAGKTAAQVGKFLGGMVGDYSGTAHPKEAEVAAGIAKIGFIEDEAKQIEANTVVDMCKAIAKERRLSRAAAALAGVPGRAPQSGVKRRRN